jgi:hypothetical protein
VDEAGLAGREIAAFATAELSRVGESAINVTELSTETVRLDEPPRHWIGPTEWGLSSLRESPDNAGVEAAWEVLTLPEDVRGLIAAQIRHPSDRRTSR